MIRRFLVARREHAAARWVSGAQRHPQRARCHLAFWDALLDAYTWKERS